MEELKKDSDLLYAMQLITRNYDRHTLATLVWSLASAVNNLNRVINFKDLYISLAEGEITEEEYEKKLDENENLYVLQGEGPIVTDETKLKPIISVAEQLGYKYVDDLKCYFGLSNANFKNLNNN